MNKRNYYWIIGLFVYLFIPHSYAAAVGEFTADYDVSYAIAPTGVAIVTQDISLTNRQSNLYPKQYTILLDTLNVKHIIARDSGGTITPNITQTDGKTEILLTFNKQVVGFGKKTQFTLRYENLDIAAKIGNIWEVTIPGITEDPDLGDYSVSLQVPPSFGPNAYLSPSPSASGRWNRIQMTKGGISAAYGDRQYAKLSLRYYLENTGMTSQLEEIALPPETAFQQVTIDSLRPKPVEMVKDGDGNWLARYTLTSGQKLSIEAAVTVSVSIVPHKEKNVLNGATVAEYTKPLPFWDSEDPAISALAATYKTPRDIYDYVVGTLVYNYDLVKTGPKRKGASLALKAPREALCMEFTDLFVSIARAAGIPAREVVGYAHTSNAKLRPLSLVSDVLHAWPEYFNAQSGVWVPVDPTWGSTTGGVDYFTKLDFNHIAFTVHGLSSSQPIPAGFYRENGKEGKDVSVEFIQSPGKAAPALLATRIDFPEVVTAGFTARGSVMIENTSGTEAKDTSIAVYVQPFSFSLLRDHQTIAPFTTLTLPIGLLVPASTPKGKGSVIVTVNDRTAEHAFYIQPISWLYLAISGMIGSTGILLWILLGGTLSKKKRRR